MDITCVSLIFLILFFQVMLIASCIKFNTGMILCMESTKRLLAAFDISA